MSTIRARVVRAAAVALLAATVASGVAAEHDARYPTPIADGATLFAFALAHPDAWSIDQVRWAMFSALSRAEQEEYFAAAIASGCAVFTDDLTFVC